MIIYEILHMEETQKKPGVCFIGGNLSVIGEVMVRKIYSFCSF